MLKKVHRLINPRLLTTAQTYPLAKDGPNCNLTKCDREPTPEKKKPTPKTNATTDYY